jgi:hypothetical protein
MWTSFTPYGLAASLRVRLEDRRCTFLQRFHFLDKQFPDMGPPYIGSESLITKTALSQSVCLSQTELLLPFYIFLRLVSPLRLPRVALSDLFLNFAVPWAWSFLIFL